MLDILLLLLTMIVLAAAADDAAFLVAFFDPRSECRIESSKTIFTIKPLTAKSNLFSTYLF